MCIAGQWQKNQAYIRSLFRLRPSRRLTGRTHRLHFGGRRLSIRQRRSLVSIEQGLVANDPSLAGMFAEFGDPPASPPWVTGGPWSPWEHP
jgi:hypothetical protein